MKTNLFRRVANRVCIHFDEYGFVPLAGLNDDIPVLISGDPKKVGDNCVIYVEGKLRKAILLKSTKHIKNNKYLVDLGAIDK